MVFYVKVKKENAQKTIDLLKAKSLISEDYKIKKESDYVLIPVNCVSFKDFETMDCDLEKRELKKSYKDFIEIPENLIESLPTAFDIIGDIVVIKIPDILEKYKLDIGEAILKVNKNVNVVMKDEGIQGEYRLRTLEKIAGENRTETIHKEFGIQMKLDIERVYYSPRLANERMRIANNINGGIVLDMFSGVGPFSLMIGKYGKAEKIYAVDINSIAIKYLKENAEMNGVNINAMAGDIRDVYGSLPKMDHIIMNLPHSAYNFFDIALELANENANIYYYEILDNSKIEERADFLKDKAKKMDREIRNIEIKNVHNYSPSQSYFAFDIVLV